MRLQIRRFHVVTAMAIIIFFLVFRMEYKNPPRIGSETTSKQTNRTTLIPSFDGAPRVLLATGCSGSSASISTTKEIVMAHYNLAHYKVPSTELYKPKNNPMYKEAQKLLGERASKDALMEKAMELLHQDALQHHKILFMRLHPSQMRLYRYMKKDLKARFSTELRNNSIDKSICEVRDCFQVTQQSQSYPVFSHNGSRTDLCFERRKSHMSIMAHMDTHTWPKHVQELQHQTQQSTRNFELEHPPFQAQIYEDLFAFTHSAEETVLERSVTAWTQLVDPLIEGAVDRTIIEGILRPQQNTRSPPPPHRDLIYNYNESVTALAQQVPTLANDLLRD